MPFSTTRLALLAGALALLAGALTLLAGCDSTGAPANLLLNVNATQVAPGEDALVVLDNNTSKSYAYGCPVLGRGDGTSFVPVNPEQFCAAILVSVAAGRTVAFQVPIPADLAEGAYRVRVGVGEDTPRRSVTSPAFRVFAPR